MGSVTKELSEDSGILGPGTDLIISLVAILLLILAVQSVQHDEAIDLERHESKKLMTQLEECRQELEDYRKELRGCNSRLDHLGEKLDSCEAQNRHYRTRLGNVDLTDVQRNQTSFVEKVAREFPKSSLSSNRSSLDIDGDGEFDLIFHRRLARQRVTFGSHLLFDPDSVTLNGSGELIVQRIGKAIQASSSHLREVHVQGHADTSPTRRHRSNLNLGAQRAITVFNELRAAGLSPLEIVMSVSSYGDFMPVARFQALESGSTGYSHSRLEVDNWTDDLKQQNRRIELLLIYSK